MGRRPVLAAALALTAALCAVSAAAAKAPVVRKKQAPVRLTAALSGVQAAQWTNWWGANTFTGGGVTLNSQPPVAPAETHSALITTKRKWADHTIAVSTTTLKQLRRTTAPNTWEVGWVMFHFTDLENYYWFMVKTNGFELGKKQGSDTQHFLVTGDLPASVVGEARRIQIKTQGARIVVVVDGTKIVDYTDPRPLGAGSVGLYEEDSQVRFDSLSVS